MKPSFVRAFQFLSVFPFLLAATAASASDRVHGLWVWKSPSVLAEPRAAERLRDFCGAQGIGEVYVSWSGESR